MSKENKLLLLLLLLYRSVRINHYYYYYIILGIFATGQPVIGMVMTVVTPHLLEMYGYKGKTVFKFNTIKFVYKNSRN